MNEAGFIPVNRGMFDGDDPLWSADEPFDRRSAWIDLCQMARHQPGQKVVKGEIVSLKRGQLLASERYLAARWHWPRAKVRRFLDMLADSKGLDRIRVDTAHQAARAGAIVTLVNYHAYNGKVESERPTDRPAPQPVAAQIKERKNTPSTTPPERELSIEERAKLTMWIDFDKRIEHLPADEQSRAQAMVRGIIDGDTATAWQTPTGDRVAWEERPRLFRLALDERIASGGKLFNVLRQVIIPREFDPFKQVSSADRKPRYQSHEPQGPAPRVDESAELERLKVSHPELYEEALAGFERCAWWAGESEAEKARHLRLAIKERLRKPPIALVS